MSDTATKKATPKKPDTIYVNDPDGKKFYMLTEHDAMTLRAGDLFVRKGRLPMVKEVKKKTVRGGVDWTVRLDDGFVFDPRDDRMVSIPDLRNMTYYRPRAGF